MNADPERRASLLVPVLVVAAAASLLLFWNLGRRYLWQDEASCAVLAERLMRFGKPLSYDGRNLLTMDQFRFEDAATLPAVAARADSAVQHFVEQGDFRADTTWIGQPWGQFVLAGLSLKVLGHGTWQARLPFAACGVLTAVALYLFVRRRFDDPWMAGIAIALLLGNTFWFLHARQCRYYSPATLFLLLTVMSYLRWQGGRPWGPSLFVLSAWCWFQFDFGSVGPVLGVLAIDAVLANRRRWLSTVGTFAVLAATILPFALYYQLFERVKSRFEPVGTTYTVLLSYLNHFQLPLLLLLVAILFAFRERPGPGPVSRRRVIALAIAIIVAEYAVMPAAGPLAFYRYLVDLTPLSCFLVAYALTRLSAVFGGRPLSVGMTAVLLFTPWVSLPVAALIPVHLKVYESMPRWTRMELAGFWRQLVGKTADPNRIVVEALQARMRPGDEVLINYEDAPLLFYLDHPVRGGIGCFRVLDPDAPPPRFMVIRRSASGCTHWPAYEAAAKRYTWRDLGIQAPDVAWGNNPDPNGYRYQSAGRLGLFELVSGQ